MSTIQHFDIPVDDLDRSQKFYNDVFGWDIKK
ncbi:MAG: VOC family protein [Thermoproteota archaeon]|nr:VOC family protein [Thermoproteota archaeon]